ncbi:hypothetical protein H5410_039869 [Solanum commersonii]|uniref:Uncharacterized protein n=1 Tax=Solanum commersonii TaxID=4109 RepID=A0A9J5XM76_SOLCO|nr:hypothetical protein H5410_039869 [Solanum commersonii]
MIYKNILMKKYNIDVIQKMMGEVNGNIDTIAREGDLSPRQISNLKSGVKKTVPYLPLQVKTRSNKDTSGGVSQ